MDSLKIRKFEFQTAEQLETALKGVWTRYESKPGKGIKREMVPDMLKKEMFTLFGVLATMEDAKLQYIVETQMGIPDKGEKSKCKYEHFSAFIHQYYYDQLRIEAQSDPTKEDMLYASAQVLPAQDDHEFDIKEGLVVQDNGVLKLQAGAHIYKKFKFFNNGVDPLNIEVKSNVNSIVKVRTPALTIAPAGFEYIQFEIEAPSIAVIMHAKILIKNSMTLEPEELIMFTLDIESFDSAVRHY